MKKFALVLKALAVTVVLVIIKLIIDRYALDVIAVSPVITGIVAGVIFTIAIIFSGVLTEVLGWPMFYIFSAVMAVPGLAMLVWLKRDVMALDAPKVGLDVDD